MRFLLEFVAIVHDKRDMIGIVNYACVPKIQILNHPYVYVFLLEVDPVDWSESVGMSRLKFGSTLNFAYFDFFMFIFQFFVLKKC